MEIACPLILESDTVFSLAMCGGLSEPAGVVLSPDWLEL